ncbi:unnamed protein product [Candida verbasci]|uniref:NADP-dependent oxidoreductase domain-containing protein n=1 Tax=Candida verbasci TaxID=1227364 RepID=A0A9W4XCS0_9ASCO|nr:unnamed protein product [Candida verbasci]
MPLTTKSGNPITIGVGTGSAVKLVKREDPTNAEKQQVIIDIVKNALDIGYNHIDSAEVYLTQPEVGKAIKGREREDLFITTKYAISSTFITKESFTPEEFAKQTFKELGTDYIDLFLIHFPADDYVQTWKDVIKLRDEGLVRYIGVSNFKPEEIEKLIEFEIPLVNQIEYYWGIDKPKVLDFHKKHNILIEAYSPLKPIKDPELIKLAEDANISPAQYLLKHLLDNGILPVTTSFQKEKLLDSFKVHNL